MLGPMPNKFPISAARFGGLHQHVPNGAVTGPPLPRRLAGSHDPTQVPAGLYIGVSLRVTIIISVAWEPRRVGSRASVGRPGARELTAFAIYLGSNHVGRADS